MTTYHRPCVEVRIWEIAIPFGVVQIRESAISDRLVEPKSYAVENFTAHLLGRNGSGFEFPVGFCVQVARIEGETVLLHYCRVPG